MIVDAQYGALSSFSSRGLDSTKKSRTVNPDHIDVKIALQALVHNSQLVIPAGRSKAGLMGFYDPALGSKKRLRVRYLYRGRLHEVRPCGVSLALESIETGLTLLSCPHDRSRSTTTPQLWLPCEVSSTRLQSSEVTLTQATDASFSALAEHALE